MNEYPAGGSGKGARRLNWHDLLDAAHAQLALLRALARVRRQPIGALVSPFAHPESPDRPRTGAPFSHAISSAELNARRASIQRLELAVARAARRGLFRPSCLVRSLALADLLGSIGLVGAEIRVGVRHAAGKAAAKRASGTQLEAHAWVELDGTVLGDDYRRTHSFTPLGGVRVVSAPSLGDG